MGRWVLIMWMVLFMAGSAFAEPFTSESGGGRYELVMMNGRAVVNNRVPAIVLDTVRGIVWTCQNLQDGKPLWVKTDLGRNGDKPMTGKRYIVRMLQWQDADLRMPAVVLDTEEGAVWNCPNVIDGKATWVETDLQHMASPNE